MSYDLNGTELVVARLNGLPAATIDLAAIKRLEARVMEVSMVTPLKAPELLATFNKAYCDLNTLVGIVEMETLHAKKQADKRKAIVVLDEVPRILKEKGLASARSPGGSEDLRNAVLAQDTEYEELNDRVGQLEAITSMLRGKMKAFEMAYNSVKKILGESAFNMLYRTNPNTGDTGTLEPGEEPKVTNGFGKPRY